MIGHGIDGRSWFWGEPCRACGYNVIVTQSDGSLTKYSDYWWYCSNKKCEHHHPGEQTDDMSRPAWAK